jgi:hypothetical protein
MNEPHNRRRPKRLLTGSRTATGDQWMPRQPYPRSPQADPAASVEDALAIVADLDEPNAGVDMTIDRRKSMRAVKA